MMQILEKKKTHFLAIFVFPKTLLYLQCLVGPIKLRTRKTTILDSRSDFKSFKFNECETQLN